MKQLLLFLLLISSCAISMQDQKPVPPPAKKNVPLTVTTFLWRYAIAEFCDIDERGVYYNGITNADQDVAFTLSWAEVKQALGEAYQDLATFDVSEKNGELKKEYRDSLWQLKHNLDPDFFEAHKISDARKRYHAAWASGDPTKVKEVLKANHDLWPEHVA